MLVQETKLEGVLLLTPKRFEDDRGWFSETWNQSAMNNAGLDLRFVQDNHSFSSTKGTVRGLHYQAPPSAQGKLVRVLRGKINDIAVDVRKGSPNFGQWVSEELSADNGKQLWIPDGFLHGFVTLENNTEIAYKCTNFYSSARDGAVMYNDPELGIDWGISEADAVLSEKDSKAPSMKNFNSPFEYEG